MNGRNEDMNTRQKYMTAVALTLALLAVLIISAVALHAGHPVAWHTVLAAGPDVINHSH